MSLSIRHQWSLWRIESSLRHSDRQFAAVMSAFAACAVEGEMPQHERLRTRSTWGCQVAASAVLRLMLVCAMLARFAWVAARWLGTQLSAVLRSGRDVHQPTAADRIT